MHKSTKFSASAIPPVDPSLVLNEDPRMLMDDSTATESNVGTGAGGDTDSIVNMQTGSALTITSTEPKTSGKKLSSNSGRGGKQLLRRATSGLSADGSELSYRRNGDAAGDRDTPQAGDDAVVSGPPVPTPSVQLMVNGGRPSAAPTAATASVVGGRVFFDSSVGTMVGDAPMRDYQRAQSQMSNE